MDQLAATHASITTYRRGISITRTVSHCIFMAPLGGLLAITARVNEKRIGFRAAETRMSLGIHPKNQKIEKNTAKNRTSKVWFQKRISRLSPTMALAAAKYRSTYRSAKSAAGGADRGAQANTAGGRQVRLIIVVSEGQRQAQLNKWGKRIIDRSIAHIDGMMEKNNNGVNRGRNLSNRKAFSAYRKDEESGRGTRRENIPKNML